MLVWKYRAFEVSLATSWVAMARDVLTTRNVREMREMLFYTFGPPGWKPDAVQNTIVTPIDASAAERQAVRLT